MVRIQHRIGSIMRYFFFMLIMIAWLMTFVSVCQRQPSEPEVENPVSHDWPVSTPEAQGFHSDSIQLALNEVRQTPFIMSFLVIRNGYLVVEEYASGLDAEYEFSIRSVTKSITSSLMGIALKNRDLDSLDQTILPLFSEYITQVMDPRKHQITVRDLLKMEGGIDRDSGFEQAISTSTDWMKTIIHHPLAFSPGDTFCYTSFGVHLLSGVLTKITGISLWEYAEEFLCEPLGITIRYWDEDPKGYNFGGGAIYMTSRDMARFGYLYLRNGSLESQSILASEYVQASFTDHLCEGRSWGPVDDLGYGYLWWLGKVGSHDIRFALGYAGQFIILLPDLDMIIVATSAFPFTDEDADEQERAILQLIADRFLPAVTR